LFVAVGVIQLGIVAVMSYFLHSIVLLLICLRNFLMSLVHAPVNAAIAPRISSAQRATYLSLQGLSERIVFAVFLLLLSTGLEPNQAIGEAILADIQTTTLIAGLLVGGLLLLPCKRISRLLQ